MTEMGEEFREDEDDVADFIAHFELLDTPEKMKKALDGAKILLKKKVDDDAFYLFLQNWKKRRRRRRSIKSPPKVTFLVPKLVISPPFSKNLLHNHFITEKF
jgi:hypothetical protein